MTDDEIRLYLKPQHHTNWLAVGGFSIALLGSAAGLARWAFTAPTRDEYEMVRSKVTSVEQDHAVLKAGVEGMRSDMADVKAATKEINAKLMELRITGRR